MCDDGIMVIYTHVAGSNAYSSSYVVSCYKYEALVMSSEEEEEEEEGAK